MAPRSSKSISFINTIFFGFQVSQNQHLSTRLQDMQQAGAQNLQNMEEIEAKNKSLQSRVQSMEKILRSYQKEIEAYKRPKKPPD